MQRNLCAYRHVPSVNGGRTSAGLESPECQADSPSTTLAILIERGLDICNSTGATRFGPAARFMRPVLCGHRRNPPVDAVSVDGWRNR